MPSASPRDGAGAAPRVAIILSTFDGAAFLEAQLASFAAQQAVDWILYWRDDGSTDETVGLMAEFAAAAGAGRCVRVDRLGHSGVTASYMTLLRFAAAQGAQWVAFADQDDVWLPSKLARGVAQLAGLEGPALYCARQVLVDSALRKMGESEPVRVAPGLGPALTQNIATGCTVIMNRAASVLVAGSTPPPPSLHDWWSYLVVAAAGGRVVADGEPTVLYRQHGRNVVGAPPSKRRRAMAALRRGPRAFMDVLRAHVGALQEQRGLMSPASRRVVDVIAASLASGMPARLRTLRGHRLQRQTRAETWLFRCWFLLG